jgi:hypothetical protein
VIAVSGVDNVVGLGLAALALVYLLVVIVFPERF